MEKNKKTGAAVFLAENFVPMLLSAAVVSSTAYVYACGNAGAIMLFTAISLLYSVCLFTLFEKLRKTGKNWLSTIVILGLFFGVQAAAPRLVDTRGFNDLGQWFMQPSQFTQVHYGNTFALIALLGFILISCLYYFTRVRYRGVFVFLVCLCPFCLFAKTFTTIPVIYPIVIMTLFFFLMAGGARSEGIAGGIDSGTSKAVLAFVLAVTVIASFFPKAESAPYRENFDEFITGVSIGAAAGTDFMDFSESSSSAAARDDENVILMFYGDVPTLIKRQCFNLYDRESNTWGYYGDSNSGTDNWYLFTSFEDPTNLYDAVPFSAAAPKKKKCWIQSASGRIKAVYTAENTSWLELYNNDGKIYRTELDEFFTDEEKYGSVGSYAMEWEEIVPSIEFSELFTDELAEKISEGDDDASYDARSYLKTKEQAVQYDGYLLSEDVMDGCYQSAASRQRVHSLALSIAGDLDNAYDKASAIVKYFNSGEYIYDSEFTASDASPENFIFGTKRGSCTSYATAMTLMCRELGLTARYCEGFLIQKYQENGGYMYVTKGDSHAYVQVWTDGYGWTDFDPTSTITDDGYFDMTFIYVGAAAAAAFLIGLIVILLRPVLEEKDNLRRIKASRGAEQYSLIYRRINARINTYLGCRKNLLTPIDTAEKSMELFGCDISGFVRDYESAVYGGDNGITDDMTPVYEAFVAAYKAKLAEERKKKKK